MSDLKIGYARVDATPPLGIDIAGYFVKRLAEGVLDPIEVVAVAIKNGDSSALMITVDNCFIPTPIAKDWRETVSGATGVSEDAIFLHATHTHQGPVLAKQHTNPIVTEYLSMLTKKVRDAAVMAIADLKGAHMGIGEGEARNVAFVRRYRMKDGSAKTNPGVNNPDIVAPIGDTDERVGIVRFERECGDSIVIVNFANHPDVVGGNLLSADWPGLTRRMVEKCIDGTKCIFFNGAQGDVNHVNVHPKAGDFNDMFNDFDGCSRGYGHARHIARVVTAAVMSVYDKVEWQDNDELAYTAKIIEINSNKADPKDLPLAHKYHELHISGRDDEIPFEAMMLTTVVAEAARMVRLENAPDAFPMRFSALSIGEVAFFGIPGEPFTGVGRGIKEAKGWKMVLPCCCLGGYEGYFPMKDSYDEGGYEARSSNYKKGSAERIIEAGLEILGDLKA
jgi:hypothetical protein